MSPTFRAFTAFHHGLKSMQTLQCNPEDGICQKVISIEMLNQGSSSIFKKKIKGVLLLEMKGQW